jgi:glycosyltransferase involved in cell wall biosynthesis
MLVQKIVSTLPFSNSLLSSGLSLGGSAFPLDWVSVQKDVADLLEASWVPRNLGLSSLNLMLEENIVFISNCPSIYILLAGLSRKNVIYICWGMPSKGFALIYCLKLVKLILILKLSCLVLVNDLITLKDLNRLGIGSVSLFPYVVDSSFFNFSPYKDRKDIALAPGDNDRDETLIHGLSSILPFLIIRVTRSIKVIEYYANREHPNLIVLSNVSFDELRSLYQSSRVVLLPIKSENHAAGQTSSLEALSCGTPVVISSSRTSSILEKYKSVSVVKRNAGPHLWLDTIEELLLKMSFDSDVLRDSSDEVHKIHSPRSVALQLKNLIENAM